jgi:hypothetical protein
MSGLSFEGVGRMSEHQSAARRALLADAAAQLGDGAAPAKVGDCDS